MNLSVFVCFVFIVAVLTVIVIIVNTAKSSEKVRYVINVVVGMCLAAAIFFMPFGKTFPSSVFDMMVEAVITPS